MEIIERARGYLDGLNGKPRRQRDSAGYHLGYNDGTRNVSISYPSSREPNTGKIPDKARYEPETKTIRSVPGNHWLASMDSWDGAINHDATAQIMAAAFELRSALVTLLDEVQQTSAYEDALLDNDHAMRLAVTDAENLLERLP